MNSHDQDRIETVLQGLGEAEPNAGMQGRITAALRAEQGRTSRPNRWTLRFPTLPRLAFATVLVIAAGAWLQNACHQVRARNGANAGKPHGSDVAGLRRPTVMSPAGGSGIRKELRPAIQSGHIQAGHIRTHASELPGQQGTGEERSFPAPPLPLTEQERLLIRLIHREAPVQLAQLTTPAINAARQRDADEVTAFFTPPAPMVEDQQAPTPQGSMNPVPVPTNDAPKEIQ